LNKSLDLTGNKLKRRKTTMITMTILIMIYIIVTKLSLYLLYLDTYAKCKSGLIDNREENIRRVCKDTMSDLSCLCFIPVLNIILAFVLSIMVIIDGCE
jgi:hypothetical protein